VWQNNTINNNPKKTKKHKQFPTNTYPNNKFVHYQNAIGKQKKRKKIKRFV